MSIVKSLPLRVLNILGLRGDFGNAGNVIPKFLSNWKGSEDFAHEFISLVELARDKKEVETQLREIRSAKPDADPKNICF